MVDDTIQNSLAVGCHLLYFTQFIPIYKRDALPTIFVFINCENTKRDRQRYSQQEFELKFVSYLQSIEFLENKKYLW